MNAREERGLVIAATTKLNETHGVWVVPSATGADKRYMVDPRKGTCTCPDHAETGFKCKHQYAVEFTVKRERAADGTVTETKTMTFTEKKTYTQDWPAYNLAQQTEKDRLQILLADLARTVPESERDTGRTGPKPHCIADRIFSTCFKVYCGLSSRRWVCDMGDALDKGHLSRRIGASKVCEFFCEFDLTGPLRELVARSALPLVPLEKDFAVDSTGFSVARHVRWHDEKYGCERSGRDWVKAHVCTGVKTNCITAAAIYERDTNDCPILPQLVKATAKNFKIGEVSADKAYLSVENVETVNLLGGQPFIAPKVNTTGGVGGLFEKMFHYYQYNRETFIAKYHKRSNVESTFSAVKRLFGDHVRSRNSVAMVNEVLAKFICYNLTRVIHSQCELGIEAEFWNENEIKNDRAAVLPFVRPV
jgi:transposase